MLDNFLKHGSFGFFSDFSLEFWFSFGDFIVDEYSQKNKKRYCSTTEKLEKVKNGEKIQKWGAQPI